MARADSEGSEGPRRITRPGGSAVPTACIRSGFEKADRLLVRALARTHAHEGKRPEGNHFLVSLIFSHCFSLVFFVCLFLNIVIAVGVLVFMFMLLLLFPRLSFLLLVYLCAWGWEGSGGGAV